MSEPCNKRARQYKIDVLTLFAGSPILKDGWLRLTWAQTRSSRLLSVILYTHPITIPAVNISSLTNKLFQCDKVALSSCIMQGIFLIERSYSLFTNSISNNYHYHAMRFLWSKTEIEATWFKKYSSRCILIPSRPCWLWNNLSGRRVKLGTCWMAYSRLLLLWTLDVPVC